MNEKDIKVGETYNVRMKCVDDKESGLRSFAMETMPYIFRLFDKKDIETCVFPLLPPETAPKYDPNRLFRKGDKVKAVLRHGRIPNDGVPKDAILEVIADERDGIVKVLHKMGAILEIFNVYALYLELVTPVEELEPYFVQDFKCGYGVFHTRLQPEAEVCHYFSDMHPNAKAAAEAERDRLNAEYRKEHS